MSDIFNAVNREIRDETVAVNSLALDTHKLFPLPKALQQAELSVLAGRLLEFCRTGAGITIGVASCSPREGASYISYNLARILALGMGKRVLWVDANHLAPHPALRTSDAMTFSQFLDDPEELPRADGLVVMPGGLDLAIRKADYAGPALAASFKSFCSRYDFTFIDCPPVLESVEASLLGAVADGFIVVVAANRLKYEIVNHGINELRARRVNVLGTVLNKRRFELHIQVVVAIKSPCDGVLRR